MRAAGLNQGRQHRPLRVSQHRNPPNPTEGQRAQALTGPSFFEGRRTPEWDLTAYMPCYEGKWEGLVTEQHPTLLAYFRAKSIEPTLNDTGLITWP